MMGLLQRVFKLGKSAAPVLDYEESKQLVQSRNPADRRRVASNQHVKPEILYFLANDPEPSVRVAVAANQASPVQADLILANDRDEGVRADLALKIASLAPELGPSETDRLKAMTYEVLEMLIRDQATRVRRIVADTLKQMPNAPAGIVQRLARDPELTVAGPVLQYSPVLTDQDLLDIVRQLPIPGAATAVAKRRGLPMLLADAIEASDDVDAITALLSNTSAQIREDTLDRLIERAPKYPVWHRPLVSRPQLSAEAARKLARFVAHDLLSRLRSRTDLPAETLGALEQEVLQRLDAEQPAAGADQQDELLGEVRKLQAEGKLDENRLVEALIGARLGFVRASLSVLSAVPTDVVEKILSSHSAKGITALVWKAGLPMRFAVRLQTVLARIPVSQTLKPKSDGGFPLSPDALQWQIEFFMDLATGQAVGGD
ncbi:MAG TPA: DUF2336 domain-containing protein [Aliidongia sp.]|nr:DUF2336 domain-containing protein [Aliidongia sp.]